MKKIISLLALLIVATIVLFCFAGCKTDNNDKETTTTTESSIRYGYSAEVSSTSLKIYKDDVFVQELKIPESKSEAFVLGLAQNNVLFRDMNFDSNEDLCLTIAVNNGVYNYCCWIYDSQKGEFVYNETLSAFTSIAIDSEKKQIVATDSEGYGVYEWNGNELKKVDTKNSLPENLAGNILGSSSSNSTISRDPETTGSKVPNTTTKPNIIVPQPEVTNKPGGNGTGIEIGEDIYGDDWY